MLKVRNTDYLFVHSRELILDPSYSDICLTVRLTVCLSNVYLYLTSLTRQILLLQCVVKIVTTTILSSMGQHTIPARTGRRRKGEERGLIIDTVIQHSFNSGSCHSRNFKSLIPVAIFFVTQRHLVLKLPPFIRSWRYFVLNRASSHFEISSIFFEFDIILI